MSNIFIINASQIMDINFRKPVMQLASLSNLSLFTLGKIAFDEGGIPLKHYEQDELPKITQGCIYKYNTGQISDKEFFNEMTKLIIKNGGNKVDETKFWECWDSVCSITSKTADKLRKIEKLQKEKGFKIHVIAASNSRHFNNMQKLLDKYKIDLDVSYTVSCNINEIEPQILKNAAL